MSTYDPLKSNPRLAKALERSRSRNFNNTSASNSLGWAENIGNGKSAKELLDRGDVLAEIRAFYKERDGFEPKNKEELVDKFWSDRTWRNVNTVSLSKDVKDAYSMSDQQVSRLARIQKLHDALPNFYEEGGRGATGFFQNLGAGLADPINLVGFGAGKAAGQGAMQVAKYKVRDEIKKRVARGAQAEAFKGARSKIVRESARRGFIAGAKAEGMTEAAISGVQDTLVQGRNIEIGLQDEYSQMQTLSNMAFGAGVGGTLGGGFGAVGGVYGGKISRAAARIRENTFADSSVNAKYTEPQEAELNPIEQLESEVPQPSGEPEAPQKTDIKVERYIGEMRDQYKRNLDATIDLVQEESGVKALAEWRAGKISDENKTESMRQADAMQAGRTALEQLYKWPDVKASMEKKLEALSVNENPNADTLNQMSEIADSIARGDDAFDALIRNADSGDAIQFEKIVDDYSGTNTPEVKDSQDVFAEQVIKAQQPKSKQEPIEFSPAFSNDTQEILDADTTQIKQELQRLVDAEASGTEIDANYKRLLSERHTEATGEGLPSPTVREDVELDLPNEEVSEQTPESIASSLVDAGKKYNALTNKISRLRKSLEDGKGTPEQREELKKVRQERELVKAERANLKELESRIAVQEEQAVEAPAMIVKTPQAEALDAPSNPQGIANYLESYGYDPKITKKELGDFIKEKNPKTPASRVKVARQFLEQQIVHARSLNHLGSALEKYTEAVAFYPNAMRKMLQNDTDIPNNMRDQTAQRYEEWLDNNSQSLFGKYLSENPELELEDVFTIIRDNHGDEMVTKINDQLFGGDDIQYMSLSKEPLGWDKLTASQKKSINEKMEIAENKLTAKLGSQMIPQKKLKDLMAMQRHNMVLEALYNDFDTAIRTSAEKLGDNYPVIIDPETGKTISGKVLKTKTGDSQPTFDKRDKFGIQSMLQKARSGRASGVDETGNLVIEYPYFGTLMVRDIVRGADGSIDYAKTVEGKYITKELPNGKFINIPRKYDASESARRELEQSIIDNATNRWLKADRDVGQIKEGDRVTEKEFKAAIVEASRTKDKARKKNNKVKTGAEIDAEAEAENKRLRESVRKTVVKDAVRNAVETSETPARSVNANISSAEDYLQEEIPLAEIENAWGEVEVETREIAVHKTSKQLILEAHEQFKLHQDVDAYVKQIQEITSRVNSSSTTPQTHADKPAGAKNEPRVYVHKGLEVDIRNHFDYKRTSEKSHSVSFLGQRVGDLLVENDKTTLHYTDVDGLEATVSATSADKMADHFPRIFSDRIELAGSEGKLSKSFDSDETSTYPIDWKSSNTWGKQKQTVPVDTQIDEPLKQTGKVSEWKGNTDVTAANLDIPEGHVLAVHITDGKYKGSTRVENIKSTTPQSVGKILGKQSTSAYSVGYVPEGTKSASMSATSSFRPLDANDPVVQVSGVGEGTAKTKSPTASDDELGQLKLADLGKVDVKEEDLPLQFRGKGLKTVAKVNDLIQKMENVPWNKIASQGQYATFVQDMSDLYSVRSKYAPKGIKLPTASRVQSMNQWNRIFSSQDGIAVSTGIDILRRLSYMDRELPIIGEKDLPNQAGGFALPLAGSENANKIFMNTSAINPDGTGNVLPQPVVLLHEVGHWAYTNILEDADKLQFWDSMGKYFNNGQLDMQQIKDRLPGISTEAEEMSPSEFFANQFTQWAITQGKVNNMPLWTRMAKKITQIAEALGIRIGATRSRVDESLVDIDPDFVELFSKILPESDPMYDRYIGLHKTLDDARKLESNSHTKVVSLSAKVMVDFDDMRRKIDDAIETANPTDLENALDEVSREIYGKVGGKAGAYRHAAKPGKPGTGQSRVRIFDGTSGGKKYRNARARKALLKAHYEWRNFHKEMYSDGSQKVSYDELSTNDVSAGDSGDLNSSFEAMAEKASALMNDDIMSALTLHANNMINALAIGQDEARGIIQSVGKLEGKKIRVSKDGSIETYNENGYSKLQKDRANRRAASMSKKAELELESIVNDLNNGIVDDRKAVTESSFDETVSKMPVSKMTSLDLRNEYFSLAGKRTSRKKELEAEIKARISTMPSVKIKPISEKFEDIPVRTLEKDLFKSIKRGKFDEMNELANAIAWRKRNSLNEGVITNTSPKVTKAIDAVKRDTQSGTYDNGVPVNAPVQVRDTIKSITHRNKTDEHNSRMVAHRLVSILTADEKENITIGDLDKIMNGSEGGDNQPVGNTDELFGKFRNQMRSIGNDVKTKAGTIDATQKVSRMAINALITQREMNELGTNADELATAFSATMRGAGSIDDIFDELPESARNKIADLAKENMSATAMVMRGLIANAKDELQPMTLLGDMFAEKMDNTIYTNAYKHTGFKGMHPDIADSYAREFIYNMSDSRRMSIQTFTNKPVHEALTFFDGNGEVSFDVLETKGNFVEPPVIEGDFGTGVYLKKKATAINPEAMPNRDLQWANKNIQQIQKRLVVERANMEGMKAQGVDVSDFRLDTVEPLVKRLERAIATEAGLWRTARINDGIEGQPKVIPFIPSLMNTFDFSPTTEYTFGTETFTSLDWMLHKLENDGLVGMEDAQSLRQSLTTMTGQEVYQSIASKIATNKRIDIAEARNNFNDVLKELGYDSIDTGGGYNVFNSKRVRHADDPEFAVDDIMNTTDINSKGRVSFSGELLSTMMDGDVDTNQTAGLNDVMQHLSLPPMMTDTLKKQFQNKKITTTDVKRIADSAGMIFTRGFGENSVRIRKAGANWLAEKVKPRDGVGFYEKLDSEMTKAMMVSKDEKGRQQSILTKLQNLPDAKSTMVKRWNERNKFWKTIEQPTSHKAILMALRLGDSTVDRLPANLKQTAKDIQKFFDQELRKAWSEGLPIGYKKNYIPQVWDADSIKNNPTQFMTVMRNFFVREMQAGEVPTPVGKDPTVVAEQKAKTLMETLTMDGNDGVLLPDQSLRTRLEDPFYERVLNLSAEDIPDASEFMINDISGMIVRYSEQMSRRRIMTKEFGLGNHAASTYLNILVNGREAIVSALRNTKVHETQRRAADATMDERVKVTEEIVSPIDGTEAEIEEMVDIALDMLGETPDQWSKNKEKVRNYLINLQDPDIVSRQPEFSKRVDAIVNALSEYGGQPSGIPEQDVRAMVAVMNTMGKKPMDTNQGIITTGFSRGFRTFNNISLLAFTTLASIPDIGMPLIRSGNFMAGYQGWKKYMSDPHYREMARNVGVGIENVMHEKMAHMYHDTASKMSNSFFNFTFLNQWTNIQREASALIGYESFKAEARKAQDLLARGMQDGRKYKTAMRYLNRYGLEEYGRAGAPALDDSFDLMNNDKIRYAVMRFTNESIFAPNANDIPLWAQTPAGAMIFQLKSFPLMMGRMAKFAVEELFKGNPKHIAMLFASAGVFGTTSLAVRDVVQRRGDTDGDGSPDQWTRDRYGSDAALTKFFINKYNSIADGLGIDPVDEGGRADAVIGWLSEAFLVQGGFGLFADLLHSTVEQSDNNVYGTLRTMGAVAGPTFSLAADATEVTHATLDQMFNPEPKNSTERNAIRKIVGRVPIVGGIRGIKEDVVDLVAGEAESKKKTRDPNKIL